MTDIFNMGSWRLKTKSIEHDSQLSNLAASLPSLVLASKSVNTKKSYEIGFKLWCKWAKQFKLSCLPAENFHIAIYLASLIQSDSSVSKIDLAIYGIGWAHELADYINPCKSQLIKTIKESVSRICKKAGNKKEPITPDILNKLWIHYKENGYNASEFRTICMCVLGYVGFLRFSELVNIKRSDVKFHELFMTIFIRKSKTDQHNKGSEVHIANTDTELCPSLLMKEYFTKFNIKDDSDDFIFRQLSYCKKSDVFCLRNSGPISYTRARELLLHSLSQIGLDKKKFGLHSLRSGGATKAANSGVIDRIFKKHGRWKTESAKDGYVLENIEEKLSVTKNLGENTLFFIRYKSHHCKLNVPLSLVRQHSVKSIHLLSYVLSL